MKILCAIVLLSRCLSSLAANVTIQDGDYKFLLEDVKELWVLMGKERVNSPHILNSNSSALCNDPELPGVFQAVCASRDSHQVFLRLNEISVIADICEICAYAACSGC
uniref:guanylin n=1 Tax=Pristiophorus japonicus TaxID=55135 RepID=UPI00398E69A2